MGFNRGGGDWGRGGQVRGKKSDRKEKIRSSTEVAIFLGQHTPFSKVGKKRKTGRERVMQAWHFCFKTAVKGNRT